jgi:DNA polymerase-3 subunit beta
VKFNIEREIILKGLKKTQGVAEKSPVVPLAASLLIEAEEGKIVIRATNFEVGIITEHIANVQRKGKAVIDARKAFEIFKELPAGESHIEKKENGWIEISHEKNILFNISGVAEEEFPKVEIEEKMDFSEVCARGILELIRSTIYATSYDRTRGALMGILVEKKEGTIRMVATDGHRLALAEREILKGESFDLKKNVVIPERGAREIKRMVEEMEEDEKVRIGFGEKSIIFKAEEETLVIRLIDAEFPDYSKVIPEGSKKSVVLKRKELVESLRRVELVADEETKAVKLSFEGGKLEITSRKIGFGDAREEMDIDYGGEHVEMGLNGKYIMDILNALDDEEVFFGINDEKTPILVKGKGRENVLAVIMPIAL